MDTNGNGLTGFIQIPSVMLAVQDVIDSVWRPVVKSNAIHNDNRTTMTSLYGTDTVKRFTSSLLDACNEGIVFNTSDDSFPMVLLADQAVDAIRAGHAGLMRSFSIYRQPYGDYDAIRFSAQSHYLASVRTMGLLNGMRMIATDGSSNLPVCDRGVIRRMESLGTGIIVKLVRGMRTSSNDIYATPFGRDSHITLDNLASLVVTYTDRGDTGRVRFVSDLLNFVKSDEYKGTNDGHNDDNWTIGNIDSISSVPFPVWLMDWRLKHSVA